MTMMHPGLPAEWGVAVCLMMAALTIRAVVVPVPHGGQAYYVKLVNMPLLGQVVRFITASHWPLVFLKAIMAGMFLLIIFAGLMGTRIPERNIATVLTWNIWWTGLIISVFFLGSAWCAVCPWDALATWLVRRRLWRRASPNNSLNLAVPRPFRKVWPALILLIALTWLELGVGITIDPYATGLLALLMLVLATVSLAIYENKAFCRYICPVGRTVGFYSQLAPVELRPIDSDICANCDSLECYHGNETTEPCPTRLVMGRLQQNTYCLSCGNCVQSCPHQNIAWRLRPQSHEAIQTARPHLDEAWFMLCLLALTGFHGLTMMPFFENWAKTLAAAIGDSGRLLWTFSIMLFLSLVIPVSVYALSVRLTALLIPIRVEFKKLFSGLAFTALPLAFAYHLAHNLSHLVRESDDLGKVLANPLGIDTQPLSMMEKHMRYLNLLIPQDVLFALQAGLIVFGFWISLRVIQHRGGQLIDNSSWRLFPIVLFVLGVSIYHLWLLMQPMVMRM